MTIEECYFQMGADYKEVLARLRTEVRIEKYLKKFVKDKSYGGLCTALEENNPKEAFACAHSLKGQCLNLALTKLGHSSGALCELLRDGTPQGDISSAVELLKADYARMERAVTCFLNEKEAV